MFSPKLLSLACALAGFAVETATAASSSVPTITAYGSKFFTSDGDQFYIKGIAYQLTDDDPLIDTDQCALDAALMSTLGTNAIRVYHVDPTADHDGCMSAFADQGIYLFVDLDTFDTAIDPDNTYWNESQYNAYTAVLDAFANYDNTLGVFVGNEVISLANQSLSAPYIKAAARDVKAYRDSKGYRKIPVGYSAADIASLRPMLQNYLACGTNTSEAVDFFGLNAYEWCGTDSSFSISGYNELYANSSDYNIPIFFSETGCNAVSPRTFEDQSAILGSDMDDVWSGAIVYEWIQEANSYGLISYGPSTAATVTASGVQDGFTRYGTPTPVSADFSNLMAQWSTLTPTGVASSAYTPSNSAPACPSSTSDGWLVDGNVALPTLGESLAKATATATTTGTATGSATGTAASATATKKSSASGGKEVAGMGAALMAVMLGFVYWL